MEYFIHINNEKRGPYSINELERRGIDATSLVMANGTDQWIPAWQVDELRPLLMKQGSTDGSNAVSPNEEIHTIRTGNADGSTSPLHHQEAEESAEGSPNGEPPYVEAHPIDANDYYHRRPIRKKNHGGCLIAAAIVVGGLFALLVFSCPDERAHKEALTDATTNAITLATEGDSAEDNHLLSKAFQIIGKTLATKVMGEALDRLVEVDNHLVYSTGKINLGGKEHLVSIGVLGHVFTVNQMILNRAAEKYYKREELKEQDALREQAEQTIQEKVVNPATDAIKDIIGSVAGEVMDELSTRSHAGSRANGDNDPQDSI